MKHHFVKKPLHGMPYARHVPILVPDEAELIELILQERTTRAFVHKQAQTSLHPTLWMITQ